MSHNAKKVESHCFKSFTRNFAIYVFHCLETCDGIRDCPGWTDKLQCDSCPETFPWNCACNQGRNNNNCSGQPCIKNEGMFIKHKPGFTDTPQMTKITIYFMNIILKKQVVLILGLVQLHESNFVVIKCDLNVCKLSVLYSKRF